MALVLARVFRVTVPVALIFSIGVHWFVLQSIAWAGMIVENSRTHSFSEAVQITLSGEKPCRLCKFVEEGREAEQKDAAVSSDFKLDVFLMEKAGSMALLEDCSDAARTIHRCALLPRTEAPLTPPPVFV